MTPEQEWELRIGKEIPKVAAEQAAVNGHATVRAGARFTVLDEDRYLFELPAIGVEFEVDRLRYESRELVGELCVRCRLPGARTVDGVLSTADFNFNSQQARSTRAKLLAERTRTDKLDWTALVEELCTRVRTAERTGRPAVDLRTLAAPTVADELIVEGIPLLRHHPMILFGDGGAAKSYLSLYIAWRLAERGNRVMLADWELCGEDHRERLERLFFDSMPEILYARCERPLIHESDRLRRIARDNNVEYTVFDSVAFACDGPPESAEVAGRYFRAVRQIGGGSLHVAHVSKGENGDQKPFGSAFWHNGARSTWYAQLVSGNSNSGVLSLGLFNRKSNLGRLRPPIGFTVSFTEHQTIFRRSDVADNPELAEKLSVRQRMAALLRRGALRVEEIANEIDADVETVKRTQRRYKEQFVVIPDGRFALLEKRVS